MEHRDSQHRQYQNNKTYFITFNVYKRREFFKEELFCELFIEELKLIKELKKLKLHAFAINPDHVHLLLTPSQKYNISQIIQSLKRHFSRNTNIILDFVDHPLEGEVGQPRFQEGFNVTNNIFADFDQYVLGLKIKFNQKYPTHNISKFRWQKSFVTT